MASVGVGLRRFGSWLRRRWWVVIAILLSLLVVAAVAAFLGRVPLPEAVPAPQSSKVLAADGQVIGLLHGEENRTIVPLSAISKTLHEAVVATEDRSFYDHHGVSPKGIIRAVWANIRGRAISQGGSTITQQYVRNAFSQVGRERTVFRKIKEAALAVKLERKHSKTQILGFYLNTVYFGRGAYGAEAAARTYFKKSAKDLSLPESAYLAGVIRSPENFKEEKAAAGIRNEVLNDMVVARYLTRGEADAVKKEPVAFQFGATVEAAPVRAAYFFEYVRRLLKVPVDEGGFGLTDRELLSGGLEIHTTLDLRMQDAAEAAIGSTLDRPDDPEAALVAMDPDGRIKAMVGGRDFQNFERARGFNFAYQKGQAVGGRQAGSTFKPFTLAAFLEQGKSVESKFDAPAKISIESQQCRNKDGTPWDVDNFDGEALGQINLIDATAKSVNTVYAQVVDLVKPGRVKEMATKVGGFENLEAVCALTLGTSGVTPLEMARGFTTFAARGERPDVLYVTQVKSPNGEVVAERGPRRERVIDANLADTVNLATRAVMTNGTGRRLGVGRPAAGKTGTTEEHVDAWFVGYTPNLVAAVWMGFPPVDGKIEQMNDVRGIEVVGSSFPGTIWRKFMIEALKGMERVDFVDPKIEGELLNASPTPCPTGVPPSTGSNCIPESTTTTPPATTVPPPATTQPKKATTTTSTTTTTTTTVPAPD